MNTLAKNSKKSIIKSTLIVLTVVLATGLSAFTNLRENTAGKAVRAGLIAADFIVQPSLNNFTPLSSTPNNSNCRSTATLNCSYDVTDDGKDNIPDQASYTTTEINTYITNGWLMAHSGSGQKLYQ